MPDWGDGGTWTHYLLYLSIVEGKAADNQFIFLLCLHWDGTVVVQFKDLSMGTQIRVITHFGLHCLFRNKNVSIPFFSLMSSQCHFQHQWYEKKNNFPHMVLMLCWNSTNKADSGFSCVFLAALLCSNKICRLHTDGDVTAEESLTANTIVIVKLSFFSVSARPTVADATREWSPPENQCPFLQQGFVVLVSNLKQQVKQTVYREAEPLHKHHTVRKHVFTRQSHKQLKSHS